MCVVICTKSSGDLYKIFTYSKGRIKALLAYYFITEKAMIKSAENHVLGVNVVIPRSSDVLPILRRLVLGTLFSQIVYDVFVL